MARVVDLPGLLLMHIPLRLLLLMLLQSGTNFLPLQLCMRMILSSFS
jgi:hypothetical protein